MPNPVTTFQNPSWAELAQRAGWHIGGAPFLDCSPQAQYGIQVVDLTRPEYLHCKRAAWAGTGINIVAGVGNLSGFQLYFLSGLSGLILTIRRMSLSQVSGAALPFVWGLQTPSSPYASTTSATALDARQLATGLGTTVQINHGNAAAPGTPVGGSAIIANNGLQTFEDVAVLTADAGLGFHCRATTANAAFTVSLQLEVRQMYQMET